MPSRFMSASPIVAGALLMFSCAPPAAPPQPGAGRFELSHRPIYLSLDEYNEIRTVPESAVVHWDREPRRVVWVVDGKRPEDEWIIEWKGEKTGSGENYWPDPETKRIPRGSGERGTHEAFYTGPPVGEPATAPPRPCEKGQEAQRTTRSEPATVWCYQITVEREMPDGTIETVATYDPEVVIEP